eukprot:scaffold727_cov48-Attheya_sp.AAC.1
MQAKVNPRLSMGFLMKVDSVSPRWGKEKVHLGSMMRLSAKYKKVERTWAKWGAVASAQVTKASTDTEGTPPFFFTKESTSDVGMDV